MVWHYHIQQLVGASPTWADLKSANFDTFDEAEEVKVGLQRRLKQVVYRVIGCDCGERGNGVDKLSEVEDGR